MTLAFLKSIPMPKLVKDILTDDQGNYVPDKLLFVGVGFTFIGLAIYSAVAHHDFDPVKYGTGGGLVLGGGGVGSLAMSHMKPNPPENGQ